MLNICSLKHKIHELQTILKSDNINIMTVSETHLDALISDGEIEIPGYCIFRKDRNRFGGGVAIYVQNHIPVKTRNDLMNPAIEALWLQIHLPHTKPLIIGCCYRPPNSNVQYIEEICTMLQRATDEDREVYFLGDLNIDWLSTSCALKERIRVAMNVCQLNQMIQSND